MTETEYISAVRRNSHSLYLIAFSYVQNPADAEDVMQNTFLKLWQSTTDFADSDHMDRWLRRVCINECRDLHRLAFRKSVPLDDIINVGYDDKHFDIDLFRAVSTLPKKQRLVVHLFYYEDMSVADISAVSGIKEPTVRSLLHRAREKLKSVLEDDEL